MGAGQSDSRENPYNRRWRIQTGTDVLKGLAFGAQAVGLGRPYTIRPSCRWLRRGQDGN
ncbi:alpha-hydroxy-acid oxidizing protein [Chloroflexota bacterium]